MPQAIPAFFSGLASAFGYGAPVYVGTAGAAAGYAAAGVAFGNFIISTGIMMGLNVAASKLMAPKMDSMASALSVSMESMPPKRFVYGETRVGGTMVFMGTSKGYWGPAAPYNVGVKRDTLLHMIVEVAGHPIESFDEVYYEDQVVPITPVTADPLQDAINTWPNPNTTDGHGVTRYRPNFASNQTNDKFNDTLMFKFYDGTQTQADKDLMESYIADPASDPWTANHIGQGRAYVYIRAHYWDGLFSGFPEFSFKIKGKSDIYNPTANTRGGLTTLATGYTDNTALCTYDYLTSSREKGGIGEDQSQVDVTSLDAAAAICDEQVEVYEDTTEHDRYFVGGGFQTGGPPASLLEDMLDSMNGSAERVNGKWHINAGAYTAPAMTLTESEMRDYPSVNLNAGQRELFNSVKPVMRSPTSDWAVDLAESIEGVTLTDCTYTNSTNTINATAHGLAANDRVQFNAWKLADGRDPSQIPAGLSPTAWYYVISPTTNAFQVSLTEGGAAEAFTTDGTGGWAHFYEFDTYLTEDGERITTELSYPMINNQSLGRRLATADLLQHRQETTAALKLKPATAWACPMDLKAGDSVRWIDAHKDFWELTGTEITGASMVVDFVTSAGHGLSEGDPIVITDNGGVTQATENKPYYVKYLSTSTFQFSEYRGGPKISDSENPFGVISFQPIQGKLFRVLGWQMNFEGGSPGIDIEIQETAPNIFTWESEKQEAPPARSGITVSSTLDVDAPTNLTVTSGTNVLLIRNDGSIVSRAKLEWDENTSEFVENGGYVEIEYKPTVGSKADFTTDFGADANQLNATAHGFVDDERVLLTTTGTLPAGLAVDTYYYIVNATTNAFELSNGLSNTPITLTDNGTGTHTADNQDRWISHGVVTGASTETYISDLNDGTDYDFQVRFRNSMGARSDYNTVTGHTLVGKTAPPADPTAFTATYSASGYSVALAWTDPTDIDLASIQVWRRIGPSGSYTFIASVDGGVESFTDYVTPSDADVVYYYQVKARDTTGNESGAVSANDTVDKVPAPAAFNLTSGASQYYEFDVDWTAGSATDWLVVQWWFTQDSDKKQILWVPYDDGNLAIAAQRTSISDGATAASMEVTARAWHVTYVRGVQVISAATINDTVTAKRWPAPTGLSMDMAYSDPTPGPASSQSDCDFTIPATQVPYVSEIQLWSNLDLQTADTIDQLENSTTNRNSTNLTFPVDSWATGAQPSETWPTFGVFYYRNGMPSESVMLNFTMPADDTGSPYTFS